MQSLIKQIKFVFLGKLDEIVTQYGRVISGESPDEKA